MLAYSFKELSKFTKDNQDYKKFNSFLYETKTVLAYYLENHKIRRTFDYDFIDLKLPPKMVNNLNSLVSYLDGFSDCVVREENLSFLNKKISTIFGKFSIVMIKYQDFESNFYSLVDQLKSLIPQSKKPTVEERFIKKFKDFFYLIWEKKLFLVGIFVLFSLVVFLSIVFGVDVGLTIVGLATVVGGAIIYKLVQEGFLDTYINKNK